MPLFYPSLAIDEAIISKSPEMPKTWIFQEGWTKYANGTSFPVEHPEEDVLFFDIENCVAEGPWPTLATAMSSKGTKIFCFKYFLQSGSLHKQFITDFFTTGLL